MVTHRHPHIHYSSMNFSVFALIYYFLILFIYSVFYSDVPRQSPTGGVARFSHGGVGPKHLISGLKYAGSEWKACLCSFGLHPTVGVFCLILDVLCIDPSLQVGVMFPLLTQVCIKFLFFMNYAVLFHLQLIPCDIFASHFIFQHIKDPWLNFFFKHLQLNSVGLIQTLRNLR